ncbi:ADP-ribose 1''-phosphate phosphatase [Crassisporium funariophilum]|nr:ADP-ribose 1''-phosphate phosphatase [Crassisporium funariophilum]
MSKLSYIQGDLFSAPDNSILVHACNTLGSWGGGIAIAFRENYPTQFQLYKAHCKAHGQELVGTCLLIPGDKHDIACLFTSRAYGRRKDTPAEILAATRTAVKDLQDKNTTNKALHACRFNSGKFAVPWNDTEAVLKPEQAAHIPQTVGTRN